MGWCNRFEKVAEIEPGRVKDKAARFWSQVGVGEAFTVRELYEKHGRGAGLPVGAIDHLVARAREIGAIRLIEPREGRLEWCEQMPTVKRWVKILSTRNMKHVKQSVSNTALTYLTYLKTFNKWVAGRKYENTYFRHGGEGLEEETEVLEVRNVEDLIKYMNRPMADPKVVKRIITDYLLDESHAGKSVGTMSMQKSALLSYFHSNEIEMSVKFNPKRRYEDKKFEKSMDLGQFLAIVQRTDVMGRAVLLCKFQRGLDNATLIDGFNHEAWEQIAEHMGTENHRKWDVKKCPVPVTLTRVKTRYKHLGFLDIDAVGALAKYLDVREEKYGVMRAGDPMFLNKYGRRVGINTLDGKFRRAAASSGVATELGTNARGASIYNLSLHETRDLLKSTLITCGCRYDVADHVIGHMPKDTYEKQATLYADDYRAEYAKASGRINVVSNLSNFVSGKGDIETREKMAAWQKKMDLLTKQNEEMAASLRRHETKLKDVGVRAGPPGVQPGPAPEGAAPEPVVEAAAPAPEAGSGQAVVEAPRQVREYECAKCGIIHEGAACPECGGRARRPWKGD